VVTSPSFRGTTEKPTTPASRGNSSSADSLPATVGCRNSGLPQWPIAARGGCCEPSSHGTLCAGTRSSGENDRRLAGHRSESWAHRVRPSPPPTKQRGTALAEIGHNDDVLEALDGLLVVLRDSTRRNQDATRRAQTIRRLRSRGRSYREILGSAERALILQITRENLDGLLQASSRLRRAEARALYAEGMTMEEIAEVFGVTRQRVSVLLRSTASAGSTGAGRR
jgi:Homeodomain-like domain-containing protein